MRRGGAVCGIDIGLDEFVYVRIGIPEKFCEEIHFHLAHLAHNRPLMLGINALYTKTLIISNRLRENPMIRERLNVIGKISVIIPNVGSVLLIRHSGNFAETVGASLVTVSRQAMVSP